MTGIELQCRREALGMTQQMLADSLGVSQATVSAWERGTRGIPHGVTGEVAELEDALTDLTESFLEAIEDDGMAVCEVVVFRSNSAFHAFAPELRPLPAVLQRVAAARASALLRDDGVQLRIVPPADIVSEGDLV